MAPGIWAAIHDECEEVWAWVRESHVRASDFAEKIEAAKQHGDWWEGRCPGHDDQRKSLGWRDGDRGVVFKCHAGCSVERIAASLGL
jgi:hypothetical protein